MRCPSSSEMMHYHGNWEGSVPTTVFQPKTVFSDQRVDHHHVTFQISRFKRINVSPASPAISWPSLLQLFQVDEGKTNKLQSFFLSVRRVWITKRPWRRSVIQTAWHEQLPACSSGRFVFQRHPSASLWRCAGRGPWLPLRVKSQALQVLLSLRAVPPFLFYLLVTG